jgi:hypothetical protein
MCGMQTTFADSITAFGIKVFLLSWIIFVPIVITSRLEKIIKLLEEKK